MSRNILVPDAPETESDTTEEVEAAEEQEALNSEEETANVEPSIPDKYKGKSLEQIIEMHINAEKEIGRQANEVGTYRELLKSMSEVQAPKPSQTDTTESKKPVEVSSDDLWDNPTGAIRAVVEETLKEALTPLQQSQQQQQLEAQVKALMEAHPDAEEIGATEEFNQWVQAREYRLKDAQKWVESYDVSAADRLLSDYKEFKGLQTQKPTEVVESEEGAVRKARAVATESGRGSGGPKGKETLSKREVMKVFINDRDLYDSPSYQKKLLHHARNGTLVD